MGHHGRRCEIFGILATHSVLSRHVLCKIELYNNLSAFFPRSTFSSRTWNSRLCYLAAWFSDALHGRVGRSASHAVLSHGLAGVLHVQICLSHFSMHTYHGQAYNSDDDEWFRMQVMTTMNINCSEWMDWFHGGLQFQIEHHLWPRLPRLREARKYTKALCKKYKIHYHEPGWFEAQKEMVSAMRDVALSS